MDACLLSVLISGLGSLVLAPAAQAQATSFSNFQLSPSTVQVGGASVTASVTVLDGTGNPLPGETVVITPSDTTIPAQTAADLGTGTYTATFASSTTAGQVTFTATDTSTAGVPPAEQTLTQTPGTPANITLSLAPSSITANGSSSSTATASLTDTYSNAVPGQTVAFNTSDPGEQISSVTDNGDGTYSATITSSTTPGTPTITASAAGLGATQTLTQTVGPAANVVVTVQPPVIKADGASAATATATVTDAFGNPVSSDPVTFTSSNHGDTVFDETQSGNVYTVAIRSSFSPGSSTITARDVVTGARGVATLKEVSLSSTLSLVSSPSSAVTNQSVTLVATVSSPGSASGTITFYDGFTPIPGCGGLPIGPGGPAALCLASFAASSSPVPVSANFTPDISSTVAGSSASISLPVAKDSTSIALHITPATATVGAPDTVTASVGPSYAGTAPTGSVEFENGGVPIGSCRGVPVSSSAGGDTASCTVTYQSAGSHQISAVYSGDQNFNGSSSSAQIPVVPRGFLPVTMQWSWGVGARSTGVALLQVNAISPGTNVLVSCKGRGCPFTTHMTALRRGVRCTPTGKHKCGPHRAGPLELASIFRGHRLMAGTRITVQIRRPGWVGKYYSFTIRAHRLPLIRESCLAPGVSKPGVHC